MCGHEPGLRRRQLPSYHLLLGHVLLGGGEEDKEILEAGCGRSSSRKGRGDSDLGVWGVRSGGGDHGGGKRGWVSGLLVGGCYLVGAACGCWLVGAFSKRKALGEGRSESGLVGVRSGVAGGAAAAAEPNPTSRSLPQQKQQIRRIRRTHKQTDVSPNDHPTTNQPPTATPNATHRQRKAFFHKPVA